MVQEFSKKALGRDRQEVAEIDEFRAGNFVDAVISGTSAYDANSGQTLYSVVASSIVRGRFLNIHLHNRETSYVTLIFRDGSITGGKILGPYTINAIQERIIPQVELQGRFFLSGVHVAVISGTFAQGTEINYAYVLEPDPNEIGGYLE